SPTLPVLPAEFSAQRTFERRQVIALAVVLALAALGLLFARLWTVDTLFGVAIVAYLASGAYKVYVLYMAARYGTPSYPPPAVDDADLPLYTVLVPLFREADVIPGLLD